MFLISISTSVQCYEIKHEKNKFGVYVWTMSEKYVDDTEISIIYECRTSGAPTPYKLNVDLGFPINLEYEDSYEGYYTLTTDNHNLCKRPYWDDYSPTGRCHDLDTGFRASDEKFLLKYAEIQLNRIYRNDSYNETNEVVSIWKVDWYSKALVDVKKECQKKQDEVGTHLKRLLNKFF